MTAKIIGEKCSTLKASSILSPPWHDAAEAKTEELCNLLFGKISAPWFLSEISVLKEEERSGKPLASLPIKEIAEYVAENKCIYPTCNVAYTLLLTAPATVASNERSFRKLKLVKTRLRKTMSQERRESVMLLSSEKEIAEAININSLIKQWVLLKRV